jgi:hypothetical protein
MSRGVGATQRRMLDVLKAHDRWDMTTYDLAQALGISQRQVRTAVRSLESRGLVEVFDGGLPRSVLARQRGLPMMQCPTHGLTVALSERVAELRQEMDAIESRLNRALR